MVIATGFTFLVVAYNHEKFILEHLESIKYLVQKYGSCTDVSLIINDDCSVDATRDLIDQWLKVNSHLFFSVVKIYNDENKGTCASVVNMLSQLKTDCFKITAGDDVYSYENIFKYSELSEGVSILSGVPLHLYGDKIELNKLDFFNVIASSVIYGKQPLSDRFKFLSNSNAPNIFYNSKYVLDSSVLNFVKEYDVVEDWPIQVALSENYIDSQFQQVDKVFVYYRRTVGSTYIVARGRFYSDKIKMFDYLIENEVGFLTRLMLINRRWCFSIGRPFVNKFFNMAFYYYLILCLLNFRDIFRRTSSVELSIDKHVQHYSHIKKNVRIFVSSQDN